MVSKLGFCRLLEGEFNALAYPGGCLVTRWQWAPQRDLYGGRSIKTVGAPDLGVVNAQSTQTVQKQEIRVKICVFDAETGRYFSHGPLSFCETDGHGMEEISRWSAYQLL